MRETVSFFVLFLFLRLINYANVTYFNVVVFSTHDRSMHSNLAKNIKKENTSLSWPIWSKKMAGIDPFSGSIQFYVHIFVFFSWFSSEILFKFSFLNLKFEKRKVNANARRTDDDNSNKNPHRFSVRLHL